jgi:glucose uptake protein GlcU
MMSVIGHAKRLSGYPALSDNGEIMLLKQLTGFSLALMAMIAYSLYLVPRKRSHVSQRTFTFWMGCGILLGTGVIGLLGVKGIHMPTHRQYGMMFIGGLVWSTGTLAYCVAIKSIGLARSTPIKNLSALMGTFIGILLFHEFTFHRIVPTTLVIMGSVLTVISTTILGGVEATDDTADWEGSAGVVVGLLAAFWAAIAYSAYTIPMKIVYAQGVTPTSFLFFMGQGCFVGMTALALVTKDTSVKNAVSWRDRNLAGLAGITWAVGSFCANTAISMIGVAVAWPIMKNTLFTVLYGVFVLREVDVARRKRELTSGLALSFAGVVLLALAMRR